jgi:hypothetical protein
MKTLLCPIDFSKSSETISQYVAQMAHDNEAKVVLAATNPRFDRVPAGDDLKSETIDRLGEWHDWITNRFKIPCTTEDVIIQNSNYKELSLLADHYDMVVVGLPQSKLGREQRWIGLDLIRTIQETLAPLLIVPEQYQYKKVKRLLYAFDYHHESEPPMMQLGWLANWFDAEVKLISILPEEIPAKEEDKFYNMVDNINHKWNPGKAISFETIVYHDVSRCLEHFLSLWEMNDLLVLSVNHQSLMQKIWRRSVVKQLLKFGTHPYLILHR